MLMKHNDRHNEFMVVISQCQGTLYKVCLHFTQRQRDEMRDLYQEIVAQLWVSWPDFRGQCQPNTWVTRVALNVAGLYHRKRRRRPDFEALDEAHLDLLVEEATDSRFQPLYSLIDQLDIDDRKLIFLYLDRLSSKEMAEITGLSEANVRQRIHRIKDKLITLKQQNDE